MPNEIEQSARTHELRGRIAALRKELEALLEEWFVLQHEVRPNITAKYDALFHELEVEIQRKALQAAEIGRRAELFGLKHRRGERITPEVVRLINTMVDKEFKKMRERMYEAFDMTAEERNTAAARAAGREADSDFPKMYRTLVKKLHPDVSDEREKFGKYWNSVQTAFETKNTSQMRALYLALAGDEAVQAPAMYPDLLTEERALEHQEADLRQKVEREQRKLRQLRCEEPFTLEANLGNPAWVIAHRENLEHQIANKEREISRSRRIVRELTGMDAEEATMRHNKPGTHVTAEENAPNTGANAAASPENEQEADAENGFFDTTYFGNR